MTATLAEIWRYPVKAHGREQLIEVRLTQGECLPWDRRWAVAHEASCFDVERPRWQPCSEFSRAAKSPRLQAISVVVNTHYNNMTFSHPDRPDLTIDPDNCDQACEFIPWVMPISNGNRMLPARLIRARGYSMTDTDFASVSLINMASHRAVQDQLGQDISPNRWRGNLLLEGLEPWAEMDWVGRTVRIGEAELTIREIITRCTATAANPETGARDADVLGALQDGWGHRDCGVYAVVTKSGALCQGNKVELL